MEQGPKGFLGVDWGHPRHCHQGSITLHPVAASQVVILD